MKHNAETGDLFDFTDLDEKLTEAHYNRAFGYLRLGELELATKAAQVVLKINQDYPPALSILELIKQEYFVSGLTSIKENKVSQGIRAFQSVVAIDPTFVDAYYELARLYLNQDELEEAAKATKKLLQLDSGSESAHKLCNAIKHAYCTRGHTDFRLGRLTEAKASVDKILELDSNYEFARQLLKKIKTSYYDQGITFLKQNLHSKAIASFKNALAIDRCFTDAYCGIARAYLDQGEFEAAKKAIRKVFQLDPNSSCLEEIMRDYYERGRMCLTQGKLVDAQKVVDELLQLDLSYKSAYRLLEEVKYAYYDRARECLKQSDLRAAAEAICEILHLDSGYEPARQLLKVIKCTYYEYGCAFITQGRLEAAEKAANTALRLDSGCGLARQLLKEIKHLYTARGSILLNEKRDKEANSDFQKAGAIDAKFTETDFVKACCQLGDFYLRQNEFDRAHKAIIETLHLDADYGSSHKLLRKLKQICYDCVLNFLNEDQYSAAITFFESLLAIDPDFAAVKWRDAFTCLGQGDLVAVEKTVGEILEDSYWFDRDYEFVSDYWFDLDYAFASALWEKIKDIYYDQGITFFKENQYNEAIANFESAIGVDMNFVEAYIGLQDAYLGQLGAIEDDTEEIDIMTRVKEMGEVVLPLEVRATP